MSEAITVKQADAFNDSEVLVTLSDGRVLVFTLDQLLGAQPKTLPKWDEEDGDSD